MTGPRPPRPDRPRRTREPAEVSSFSANLDRALDMYVARDVLGRFEWLQVGPLRITASDQGGVEIHLADATRRQLVVLPQVTNVVRVLAIDRDAVDLVDAIDLPPATQ